MSMTTRLTSTAFPGAAPTPATNALSTNAFDDAVDVAGALMAPLGYDQIEGLFADAIVACQPLAAVADGRGVHLDVEPARLGTPIRVDDLIGHAGEVGPGLVGGIGVP